MRRNRRFQPTLDLMPIRITPSDALAPIIYPYTTTDPTPTQDPLAPVVAPYTLSDPLMYADT